MYYAKTRYCTDFDWDLGAWAYLKDNRENLDAWTVWQDAFLWELALALYDTRPTRAYRQD